MTTRDAFEETVNVHIQELLDSIEHHEAHLQSTEAVSLDSHLAALDAIKQKHEALVSSFPKGYLGADHAWHDIQDQVYDRIERLKQEFDSTSG